MDSVVIAVFGAFGWDRGAQGVAGAGRRLADELGTELQALVTVEPTADGFRAMEVGTHELVVRNADGVVGSSSYEVLFDDTRLDINRSSEDTVDRVDGKDLVWLAYAHGASEGDNRFNADADLNGDGYIDGEDLAYLATSFGTCWNGADWLACP